MVWEYDAMEGEEGDPELWYENKQRTLWKVTGHLHARRPRPLPVVLRRCFIRTARAFHLDLDHP